MSAFLTFLMGGEACAVDLAHVREIVRFESATRVPRVPDCIRGVVNVRGDVVPVVDLAVGLGMPEAPVTALSCLVVVELALGREQSRLGLLVDAVSEVLEVRPEDVQPPAGFGTAVPAAFLLGLAHVAAGFVLLLDLERMLGEGGLLRGMDYARAASDSAARGKAAS